MALELFKLLGTIAIDNQDANSALEETTGKASSFGSKLAKGMGTAAKWGTAIVGGATAAAGGLVKFAESSATTADGIDKMSQKIGVSREAYQELDFICSQSGTSVDGLQAGMKSLTSAMSGAGKGTKKNVEQFKKLGVAVQNADGTFRSQEEVLYDTLEALQGVSDQTEKTKLATELFGRSGTELMPLLNQASGSITDMKDKAHELGLVMSDEMVDDGVELQDTLDQTKRAFSAIGTQLGGSLMPIVTKVAKYIQKALPSIKGMIDRLAPVMTSMLESLLPKLMSLGEQLLPPIVSLIEQLLPIITQIMEGILPVIVELVQTLLPPLMQIIQAILPVVTTLLQTLIPIIQQIFACLQPVLELIMSLVVPIVNLIATAIQPLIEVLGSLISSVLEVLQPILNTLCDTIGAVLTPILEALSPIFETITSVLQPLFDIFSTLIEVIFKPLSPILEALGGIISGVLGAALEGVMTLLQPFMDILQGLIDFITGVFTGNWEQAWDGIVGIFKGIFNVIPAAIEAVINGAIWLINCLIDGINCITGLIGIPEIPNIPDVEIPRLEKGGVLEKGQVGLLEGNGAEAVVPLENNSKWIHSVAQDMAAQGIGGSFDFDKMKETFVSALREVMPEFQQGILASSGDICIPVYLGNSLLDEVILESKKRVSVRSGGFANV